MYLSLDLNSEVPIYTQIRNQIIIAIAKEELKEGDSLPSVRQMASDIGINLHTVNKAYNMLKQEGFLAVRKRKGVEINSRDEFRHDSEYVFKLSNQLELLMSEALCRGMKKEDISKIVTEIIDNINRNIGE